VGRSLGHRVAGVSRPREPRFPAPKRDAIPEPTWRGPDCGICAREMAFDGDAWRCEPCGYSWCERGREGTWDDEHEPQCAAVLQPHKDADPERYPTIIGIKVRCKLGAYHALAQAPQKNPNRCWDTPPDRRLHHCENYDWKDGDPREVTPRLTDDRLDRMRGGIDAAVERAQQHQREQWIARAAARQEAEGAAS
jgi:hypothetical protein